MSFSYDFSEPAAGDRIRRILGDTDDQGHLLEDETIAAMLAANDGSELVAATEGCRAIIAKLAKQVDRSHPDGISTNRSQRFANYKDLLVDLQAQLLIAGGGVGLYAGGTSKTQDDSFEHNTDNKRGVFAVGMWDEGGTGRDGL